MEPASIRYNNPGAMWGGTALTKKWGETSHVALHDGLGQGNQIAIFPDKVHGAAAQFDLWRTSKNYANKQLQVAIKTWSGGNSWQQYMNFLISKVKGLTAKTIINEAFLSSPSGIDFVKAQAFHEAGEHYPMSDDEWKQAQALVFNETVAKEMPTTKIIDSYPIVQVGSTGASVNRLQRLLSCKETDAYLANSETEFALKLFQVRHKLIPDGVCGQLTWNELNSKASW